MIVFIASIVYVHTCKKEKKKGKEKNGFDQIIPVFKGWMLQIRSLDQQDITKNSRIIPTTYCIESY